MAETIPNLPPGFDFTDPDVYSERLPTDELAELRRVAPIWWNAQPHDESGFGDNGFWVVTKYKDVRDVSRRSDVFSNAKKTALPRYSEASGGEIERGLVLLNQDAPTHTRLRKAISRAFTPRAVELLRADLNECAHAIARRAREEGTGDFVEQISNQLPMQAIGGLMGVPQGDRKKLFIWINQILGRQDTEFADTDTAGPFFELTNYCTQLAADRVAHPRNDLLTRLVQPDVEGRRLFSDDKIGSFLLGLITGETSRDAITQGMVAFTEFPEQWELFKKHRPATAVAEIVRWSTPVTSLQRTALEDTELSGVKIKKDERVVLFYRSANFDEEVFDDPFKFNIFRDPNPHLSFGGTGPHFCIGANLARMTIELMFNAIADHIPDLTPLAEPERLRSGVHNGIKHLQVDYTGASK